MPIIKELETICVLVSPMVCSAVGVKNMISVKQRYVCSEFCGDMLCVSVGYKAGRACQLCGR